MSHLIQIGYLCKRLGTTSRSVRYYEEMGLITSIRPYENNYRYFDNENYIKLKIILFLRSLDISIQDISDVLKHSDLRKFIEVLQSRTYEINHDIEALSNLKDYIHNILEILDLSKHEGLVSLIEMIPVDDHEAVGKTLYKEAFSMVRQHIQALKDNDVKIVKLPDMKVAYVNSGMTKNPEGKAITEMMEHVRKYNLYKRDDLRFFGFDHPAPKSNDFDNEVYGYEMWMKLPKDYSLDTGMEIKNIEGGLYATVSFAFSSGTEMIPKRWQQLIKWVNNSKYEQRDAQWLEEYMCRFDGEGQDEYDHLEFYLPIK
ncbi:MerR family transcriptional regulator [Haloplasma contractile]|uniref:MerR-family transcriptional regulator protein n=1 Tax=Haloplasma contractile SSD-17B TaxID=1033810 RepID=F7Q0F3_9MOLU|nr:effector binding domain-containing protein [Haloplasma contractile]ERJ12701.1 Putative MerR-family transcriptional regulator protein [Haloplasma contractile SSD-17B]